MSKGLGPEARASRMNAVEGGAARTNRNWKRTGAAVVLAMAIATSPNVVPSGIAFAATQYVTQDTPTNSQMKGRNVSVSGDQMVWIADDSNGVGQIHYMDLKTGESKVLTSSGTAKDSPAINGSWVVWVDKSNQLPGSLYWDIYSYNLATGETKQLNKVVAQFSNPSIDGDHVVSFARDGFGAMFHFDLTTGKQTAIGDGRFPWLAKGKVVYMNARDGGLSLYDLTTGKTKPLVSLPNSSSVDWFVFNGDQVVWKQRTDPNLTKIAMLNVAESGKPVELSPNSVKTKQFAFMEIGNTQAAWIEENEGEVQVRGVDLKEGTAYTIGKASGSYLGYSGDRLLMTDANGTLTYRDITKANGSGAGSGSSEGSKGGGGRGSRAVVETGTTAEGVIDPSGGQLASADGKVKLDFAAGTFKEKTKVGIRPADETEQLASKGIASSSKLLSGIWSITSEASFGKAAGLTMSLNPVEGLSDSLLKQAGIYTYRSNTSTWTFVGGMDKAAKGELKTLIDGPGIYAVMTREVTFGDTNSHWARPSVEALASRGIVDGMSDQSFAPDGTLTRAQFTKMLAGAVGLEPLQVGSPTFSDVARDFWGYGWIEAAARAGLVEGDNGQFHPQELLTREQMMAMLIRAVGGNEAVKGMNTGDVSSTLSMFTDADNVSLWAQAYAAQAVKQGLVEGDGGRLSPQQSSTRAQAAAVIYRLLVQQQKLS